MQDTHVTGISLVVSCILSAVSQVDLVLGGRVLGSESLMRSVFRVLSARPVLKGPAPFPAFSVPLSPPGGAVLQPQALPPSSSSLWLSFLPPGLGCCRSSVMFPTAVTTLGHLMWESVIMLCLSGIDTAPGPGPCASCEMGTVC